MKIPFHKPHITKKEIDSVVETMQSGWLTMGPKTLEFEEAFKHYIGSDYTISLNSATAALHLALNAVDVGIGDDVKLISSEQRMTPIGDVPRVKKLEVIGIFESGISGYDEVLAFADYRLVQKIYRMGSIDKLQ